MTAGAPVDATPVDRTTSSQLDDALREGNRVRYGVTVMFVGIVVLIAAGFGYYRYEQAHACDVARQVRVHSEGLDRDVFARLGQRFGVDDAEVAAIQQDIGQAYDAMPEPAAC